MIKKKIEDLSRFNNIGLPLENDKNGWVFYVISLSRIKERKVSIIKQLLPFIGKVTLFLFDAIDWRDYSLEDFKSEGYYPYKKWKLSSYTGINENWFCRELRLGEVAACVSHYNVWKHIQNNGFNYSLILEDDAIFELEKFAEGLNLANNFLTNNPCDIFYLDSRHIKETEKNISVDKHIEICGYEYNAHAYIITKDIAKEIVSSGIKENLISPDEFLTSTFCEHPREDIRNLYNNKRLIAHKLSHEIKGEGYYVTQSIAHNPNASNYGISELETSEEIKW